MSSLATSLPGTWKLLRRFDRTAQGERRTEPAAETENIALLIYDRSGNFAAQFMKRDRSGPIVDAPSAGQNNSRAIGGYDAYFGTYTINEADGTVTQTLVGALSKENVGIVVTRQMKVEGDTLTIQLGTTSPAGEPIIRTLIWQRAG